MGCLGPEMIWPGLAAGVRGGCGGGVGTAGLVLAGAGAASEVNLVGLGVGRTCLGGICIAGALPEASGGRMGAADLDFTAGLLSSVAAGGAGASTRASGGAGNAGSTGVDGPDTTGSMAGSAEGGGSGRADLRCAAGLASSPEGVRRRRISRATSSSTELEWVFFSETPSSGKRSRMTPGLTSSSRASSLMRNLLI